MHHRQIDQYVSTLPKGLCDRHRVHHRGYRCGTHTHVQSVRVVPCVCRCSRLAYVASDPTPCVSPQCQGRRGCLAAQSAACSRDTCLAAALAVTLSCACTHTW